MDLSIIIVNYNSGSYLKSCIASVKKYSPKCAYEIIVVDNGSRKGDIGDLQEVYPEVGIVLNSKNEGFARANNQAVSKSRGKYLLLLNPDTLVLDKSLDGLLQFMEENSDAGAAGPTLLYPDGTRQPSCRRFPTPMNVFFGRNSLLTHWFPGNRFTQSYLRLDLDGCEEEEVDWVTGACMIIRRDTFQNVGGFDETFFLYVEDADLCYRLLKNGWKVFFVPEAQVIHQYGASVKSSKRQSMKEHNLGMYRFFLKHYKFPLPIKGLLQFGLLLRLALLPLQTATEKFEQ
jgi:GT2 family glycosyltransferase